MTVLRLDIDALVGAVPAGEAVWAMALRQHPRPRIGWLAAWRRRRRRRAGWRPACLSLYVVDGRVDLSLRGEPIASRRFADPAG